MNDAPSSEVGPDESPRIPGFRSWGAIYLLVLGFLVFYIVFFAVWSEWFA
jgi:hypothetical protein